MTESKSIYSFAQIEAVVCNWFLIEPAQLKGGKRLGMVAEAKLSAYYLTFNHHTKDKSAIGRMMDKTPQNAIQMIQRAEEMYEYDSTFKSRIKKLLKDLEIMEVKEGHEPQEGC